MVDILLNSFRNIFRKRLRSFLTMSGIAIGVMSVVIISTIGNVGKEIIHSEIESIGMGGLTVKPVGSEDVDVFAEQLNLIEGCDYVSGATPLSMLYTQTQLLSLKSECAVWGIDSGAGDIITMNLIHGRQISDQDIASQNKVVIVDADFAQMVYKRTNIVGKTMQISFNGVMEDFEIVGVASLGSNILQGLMGDYIPAFLYAPYTTVRGLSSTMSYNQIAVKLNDDADAEAAVSQLTVLMSANYSGTKIENLSSQMDSLNGILEIVTVILSIIAGISLVVAGLSVMTVMLVCVHERTREIGIKKSIGASSSMIRLEFMLESLVLSLMGGALGAGAGILLSYIGCVAVGVPFTIQVPMVVASILFITLMGVLFGVYPAAQAARLRPVDALRQE